MDESIDICVSLFNEEKNLPLLIENFKKAKKSSPYIRNLVLIDNGSTDDTWKIISNSRIESIISGQIDTNIGYGSGISHAISKSMSKNVALISANNQYPFDQIMKLIDYYVTHKAMTANNILVKGYRMGRSDPIFIQILSFLYTFIIGVAIGKRIVDVNGLPKIFQKELVLNELDKFPSNAAFDSAILFEAVRKGFDVIELPITYVPRLYGKPSWTNGKIKISFQMLEAIFKYRFKR